jgi:hypothetical protein
MHVGICLADQTGMAILTATENGEIQKVEWLHWLYMKGERAISCDVDVRGDGVYAVTLFPLWSPDDLITETFLRPGEAMRWHAEMTRRLQASGWLLLKSGAVADAA